METDNHPLIQMRKYIGDAAQMYDRRWPWAQGLKYHLTAWRMKICPVCKRLVRVHQSIFKEMHKCILCAKERRMDVTLRAALESECKS